MQIIEIDPQWLLEVAPHYYKAKDIQEVSNVKMPKKVGATSEQTRSVQTWPSTIIHVWIWIALK